MMHLRIIDDGDAYMYIGQKPVADGNITGHGLESLYDEDGRLSYCTVPANYVEKLLGRKGRDGEWVELRVS